MQTETKYATTPATGCLQRRCPHGTTLIELMIACAIIATAVGSLLPFAAKLSRQRIVHRELLAARMELMNQAERLTQLSSDQLESIQPQVSKQHAFLLQDAELTVDSAQGSGADRRIHLELVWTNRLGHKMHPQSLTVWIPDDAKGSNDDSGEAP